MTEYESLKRGKAESDALFTSIGEGAIVTDAHGNVSRINKMALDILNCSSDDVMGKWYPSTIQSENEDGTIIPNLERPITMVFMTGKIVRARIYYRRKDGTRITVDSTVSPVLIDGLPSGAIEVFRDVTEEEALEKAKDEFISLASHQLRTPATGVKQYTSMLMEEYAGPLSRPQMSMLQSIYDSNERQITIVNDLLKVAHVDAGQVRIEREDTNLTQLIQDVINEQAYKFEHRHQTVFFDHAGTPIHASLDSKNVRMVLENIIDNASKYTPDKKAIRVTLKQRVEGVVIAVQDDGVGIAKADIPKVFQKFSRLYNPLSLMVSGTGLGLYWANKIILLHGGTIKVSSQPDKGTTFTVNIPDKRRQEVANKT